VNRSLAYGTPHHHLEERGLVGGRYVLYPENMVGGQYVLYPKNMVGGQYVLFPENMGLEWL
jgi:hypothetical protein